MFIPLCRRLAAGRGEATVYRDKATGKVISAEEYTEQVRCGVKQQ
jgi:hypothetical protein